MSVNINWYPLALLGVVITAILGATVFSAFSLIIACLVKTCERFMAVGQVLTRLLFFVSNAIYPIVLTPNWLKRIAIINPLTYEVDVLWILMLAGG